MRKFLFLALFAAIGAALLLAGNRPAAACIDNDNDGVCREYDCDDSSPLKSSTADLDGDGYSECDGDCRDDDPSITFCAETAWKRFPVFYEPGEQNCRTGITVTRTFGNPPVSEEVTYLTDCAPHN
jgi:hypothetical protein